MTEDEKEILQEQINTGEKAEELLKHPMIQGFLLMMKADLMEQFGRTTTRQSDERDEIWRMTQILDRFEDGLKNYIETGKIAKKTWLDFFNS